MWDALLEVIILIIVLALLIPIWIIKYRSHKASNITCPKCGFTFSYYWFIGSTGYCPDCAQVFDINENH